MTPVRHPAKPDQVVDALNELFGVHPGCRAVHARGLVLRGEFVATPQAARLTRAVHMQGRPVPVTARFSNGSGHPGWPDWLPDVRGLAVSFHLPGGQRTDLVATTLPRFPVRTPEAVLALARALRPRLTLPLRLLGLVLRHPGVLKSLPAGLALLRRAPVSYAGLRYHAIHAFKWSSPYGSERYVRYRWLPEAEQGMAWWRAPWRGRHYLQQELLQRLRQGPVRLQLQVQIARPGDPVDDATAVWPDDRERVTVGTLTLLAPAETGDELVFDPLRLTDGIAPSRDPLLPFRTQAYAASAARRGVGHRPQHIKAA